MKNELLNVSKRFLSRYLPVLLIIALSQVTSLHMMGFNPWGLSIISKFLFYSLQLFTLFFVYIVIRYLFKPEKSLSKLSAAASSLIISDFLHLGSVISAVYYLGLNISPPGPLVLKMSFLLRYSNGVVFLFLFYIAEKSYLSEKKFKDEQMKRLQNEKKAVESKLKLLQAQVEPHFIFNTLTAVVNSYDMNINKGKTMLLNFIQYLRSSLTSMRTDNTNVKQELKLITTYLDIFCVRMGKRLSYTIEAPESIQNIEMPSMLIQPIIENAIKHGLEPKIEGGEISIRVEKKDHTLIWEIADTGLGLGKNNDDGFGLRIIEERIDSLFGEKGSLCFENNKPSGLKVIVEVPID
jgi:sensor histidine kinase YesM